MAKHNTLTLSIVIPVYNEEDHLKACLDSIAAQTIKPDEVIVVDNNSIDRSVQIAKKYKFVKIVREPKQGYIFARHRRLNAASGEVMGRVNAESVLLPDWVARVKQTFNSPDVQGIAGLGKTNLVSVVNGPYRQFWARVYVC